MQGLVLKEKSKEISKEEANKLARYVFDKWKHKIDYKGIDRLLEQGIYNQSKIRHEKCCYIESILDFNEHYSAMGGELKGKIYNSSREKLRTWLNEIIFRYTVEYFKGK